MGKLYTIQIEVTTDAPAELVLAEAEQAVEFLAEELQTHGHDVDDENIDIVVMWTEGDECKELRNR